MKWLLLASLIGCYFIYRSERKRTCGCYLDAVTGIYIDPQCAKRNGEDV